MRLLVVEPDYSGHRMVLAVRAVVTEAASRGWNVFLITSREAISHPSVMLIKKELGSVKINIIPMDYKPLQAPWLGVFGILLGQVFYYLSIKKALRENVAYINPDFVYMPTLDSCDKVISILGSPAMGVPFGGVMMAPKFHRYKLYREPKSRNDAIYEYLFRRLLKSRYIAFVWLFDKRLLMYFQEHYTAMESANPNPRIESRQRSTDLLIPLPGLVVGRHSRYETAMESKIVTRPLFHTPKAPIRVFWTDRSRKGRQVSTHFVK